MWHPRSSSSLFSEPYVQSEEHSCTSPVVLRGSATFGSCAASLKQTLEKGLAALLQAHFPPPAEEEVLWGPWSSSPNREAPEI